VSGKKKLFGIGLGILLISQYFITVEIIGTNENVNMEEQNPILFLHCWTGDAQYWRWMKDWFLADGWSVSHLFAYTFDDHNNCSFQSNVNNAYMIKQWVSGILNTTGANKVDLVGHSMGGLSSRYYIKFLDGIDYIDDYVSLGTPQHGENKTECGKQGVNILSQYLNEGDETPGGILNDTIGERIDPIWGNRYNSTHIEGDINYTSIYSLSDSVVPHISSPLDGAHNLNVNGVGHMMLDEDWSVYKLVRVAVNDLNSTFLENPPSSITTATTTTTITSATSDLHYFSVISVIGFLLVVGLKKKRE
jgi:triacylglycerol lipase